MILSSSLVKEFVRRSQTLQCNKIGDQTIAIWIYEMAKTVDITWFHDKRIFHTPSVSTVLDIFLSRSEICSTFLSLHGAYVNETVQLHEVYMKEQKGDYKIPEIFDKCPIRTPEFDWDAFKRLTYIQFQFYVKLNQFGQLKNVLQDVKVCCVSEASSTS